MNLSFLHGFNPAPGVPYLRQPFPHPRIAFPLQLPYILLFLFEFLRSPQRTALTMSDCCSFSSSLFCISRMRILSQTSNCIFSKQMFGFSIQSCGFFINSGSRVERNKGSWMTERNLGS